MTVLTHAHAEFPQPKNVHDALRSIQTLLSQALRDMDDGIDKYDVEALRHVNMAMADAHMLATWVRGQLKSHGIKEIDMTDIINATDAAKAASMLHHTWGLTGFDQALEVYNTIGADPNLDVVEYLDSIGAGIWGELENLSELEWWEQVEALALSIVAAQEWQRVRDTGESK